jgi:hypothetical protein
MHNNPFTLVRVRLLDAEGKSVFGMWLIAAFAESDKVVLPEGRVWLLAPPEP